MSITRALLSLVAVCVGATAAHATSNSTKIKDFQPQGVGLFTNPHSDGMAMIKYDASIAGSNVHLRINDMQGCVTYGVAIQATNSGSIDYSNPQAFTTNWHGDGAFEVSLPTVDLGTAPIFFIYVWDGNTDPDSINDVTITELRMLGTANIDDSPTVKIKDFDPAGTGTTANCQVDGMAIINYSSILGGSDVHLHLTALQPNVTYGVALQGTQSTSPDYSNPVAFTTDSHGAGSFDLLMPAFDLGTDPVVYIYVWDGNPDPDAVLNVSPAELRAIGAKEHHHHHGCEARGCHHS